MKFNDCKINVPQRNSILLILEIKKKNINKDWLVKSTIPLFQLLVTFSPIPVVNTRERNCQKLLNALRKKLRD